MNQDDHNAEHQAERILFPAMLENAIEDADKWHYLCMIAMHSLDAIESCIQIGKADAALLEVQQARQRYERLKKDEAA